MGGRRCAQNPPCLCVVEPQCRSMSAGALRACCVHATLSRQANHLPLNSHQPASLPVWGPRRMECACRSLDDARCVMRSPMLCRYCMAACLCLRAAPKAGTECVHVRVRARVQDPDMLVGSSPGAAAYNTPDQSRTQASPPALLQTNVGHRLPLQCHCRPRLAGLSPIPHYPPPPVSV